VVLIRAVEVHEERFKAWDAIEGTDLSIALSVLASDVKKLSRTARCGASEQL
jgi:hypothetical protein